MEFVNQDMFIEFFGDVNPYIGMGIKIVTAIFLGGVIGLDREIKLKSAGIKTNILICLGSALYTTVSLMNITELSDPNRTVAQIVSGIGFLGAGAIIQGRGEVMGLTTAATIWVVAAIGVTIGIGYPINAAIITLTVLFVLRLLGPLYRLLNLRKNFHLQVISNGTVEGLLGEFLKFNADVMGRMKEEVIDTESDLRILHIDVSVDYKRLQSVVAHIRDIPQVKKVSYQYTDESH